MMRKKEPISLEARNALEKVPDYLSVGEAANMLGVSARSIYGYVEGGKLPGARIGTTIVVRQEDVNRIERRAPGRIRLLTPSWRRPPVMNRQFLTTIIVRARPGQGAALADRLEEMRRSNRHNFPGTSSRSIAVNQDNPNELVILLIWRSAIMPPEKEREAALAVFATHFMDVLDWETARVEEGQVLLHAQ